MWHIILCKVLPFQKNAYGKKTPKEKMIYKLIFNRNLPAESRYNTPAVGLLYACPAICGGILAVELVVRRDIKIGST
jgi:hypothetical protein